MSFARTVKEELVSLPVEFEQQLAEFAAFLHLATEFHIENKLKMIDFKTNNPTVAKRFLQLARTLYQAEVSLMTKQQTKLKKRQTVIIRLQTNIEKIINEHGLFDEPYHALELITQSPNSKRAYLRAAFLSGGSVNHPKTAEYHLEIYAVDPEQIVFIQSLMNAFDLNARISKRRNGYICYIKDAEAISDFISIVGAQNAVFKFEDIRIKRDFNNSINRIMNCEIANEKKTIVAANNQIKDIEILETYAVSSQLDEKITKVMALRKKHPDVSLNELKVYYEQEYNETISRSGLNHRITRIKQLADQIREGRTS